MENNDGNKWIEIKTILHFLSFSCFLSWLCSFAPVIPVPTKYSQNVSSIVPCPLFQSLLFYGYNMRVINEEPQGRKSHGPQILHKAEWRSCEEKQGLPWTEPHMGPAMEIQLPRECNRGFHRVVTIYISIYIIYIIFVSLCKRNCVLFFFLRINGSPRFWKQKQGCSWWNCAKASLPQIQPFVCSSAFLLHVPTLRANQFWDDDADHTCATCV